MVNIISYYAFADINCDCVNIEQLNVYSFTCELVYLNY